MLRTSLERLNPSKINLPIDTPHTLPAIISTSYTPKTPSLKYPYAPMPTGMDVRKKTPVDALTKATNTANVINGVNAVIGGGLALYGLAQVDKMKAPTSLQAPTIEAKLIRDRGAATAASNKGEITTQLNTAREGLLRRGRVDMLPSLVGKGMNAMNQSSAQIEQLRMGIDQANVGAENRIREINANSKMQAGQFNSQIGMQFNQFKSQLSSSILSAGIQNVSANLGGIAQNSYGAAMYKEQQKEDYIYQLRMQASSPNEQVATAALRELNQIH